VKIYNIHLYSRLEKTKFTSSLPRELVPINTKGCYQTSFWISGIFGFAHFLYPFATLLGTDYPFYAFQARGNDGKETPFKFAEMISHYTKCIRLVQPTGPYCLAGNSFGGVVALEIAQQLKSQGEQISQVIMLDSSFPTSKMNVEVAICSVQMIMLESDLLTHKMNKKMAIYSDLMMLSMANKLLKTATKATGLITLADIENTPQTLKIAHVIELIKEKSHLTLSVEDISHFIKGPMKVMGYLMESTQNYNFLPYDASGVLYFKAAKGFFKVQDHEPENLWGSPAVDIVNSDDDVAAWRDLIKSDFQVVELPCDHFSYMEEPFIQIIKQHIEVLLKQPVTKLNP
jgi:thioesterase domain-containing protein